LTGAGSCAVTTAAVVGLVVQMRVYWYRLKRPVARHRRLWIASAVAITAVVVIGVGLAVLSPAPAGNGANSAAAQYDMRWSFRQLEAQIDAGQVVSVTVAHNAQNQNSLLAKTSSGQLAAVDLSVSASDAAAALVALGYRDLLTPDAWSAIDTRAATSQGSGDLVHTLLNAGFLLMMLGILVVLVVRMRQSGLLELRRGTRFSTIMPQSTANAVGSMAASASSPIGNSSDVRLADVAGCEEAKLELAEAIEFLRDPKQFRALGARVPRGILLFGPPGTGKTMLARAVATEAGVPFHHASGSDFVEKYVGVGAKRVRELFEQARKLGKGVIFIDEFDALGKARGGQNSHEEREQTLNQLLVELDGFGTSENIVVIGATNRVDILDEALLRPGRFSRKVHVGLPDVAGRRAILDVHARGKPLADDVSLDGLARKTYGFSGAQLADLLNESAIMAARRQSDDINNDDIHAGWLKVAVGTGRRRSMGERDRAIIAAHEVGHAICGRVHGDNRRVEEISLFAHGEALGVTVSSQEDNDLPGESDLRARLIALMGGRAAEELLFHEVTPGASNDFEKATHIATMMVNKWGMGRDPRQKTDGPSGRGALSFITAKRDSSLPTELQAAATRAMAAILDKAYQDARQTLVDNMAMLRKIGRFLVQEERIDGDTFDALFEGKLDVPDADGEWRPEKSRPRDWTEIPAVLIPREVPRAGQGTQLQA
jgi:cell division protease FtsH